MTIEFSAASVDVPASPVGSVEVLMWGNSKTDPDAAITLTPEEARELSADLLRAADAAA